MIIEGREYCLLMGSDPKRDGMFLELYAGREPNGRPLAECFYSDLTGSLALTVYEPSAPPAALAWLEEQGGARLPPEEGTA